MFPLSLPVMSNFARKKITNQDTVCDDEATPTGPNGHYVISNGSIPTSPTPLSPPHRPVSLNLVTMTSPEYTPLQLEEPDSPEFYRTKSYDEVLFDIRKIHPEKIAVSGHTH